MGASRFAGWPEAGPPVLVGIVNVTPDSFSDGGECLDPSAAVERAVGMLEAGAAVIDIGGESTRPGADPVPEDEQVRRVVPVIERLRAVVPDALVSVDTTRARVARAAVEAGANIVNDISALRDDPAMGGLVASEGVGLVLMHMQGTPRTMQRRPQYGDVVREVREFLLARVSAARAAGVPASHIAIDPGIGFGKTVEHNLVLLRSLGVFVDTGFPVMVGVSRKSFIGRILGISEPRQRLMGTAAAVAAAVLAGARLLRVHDVPQMRQVVDLAWAIRTQRAPQP